MSIRHFAFLFVLFVAALLLAVPALAQEVTPEATPPAATPIIVQDGGTAVIESPKVIFDAVPTSVFVPVVIAGTAIVLGLLAATAYMQGKSVVALWRSTPQPVQAGGRLGLEFLLNEAAKTPDPADDASLKQLAEMLGYELIVLEGGRIVLTPKVNPLKLANKASPTASPGL